ncbi:MAG: hypothetical protein GOMPHAMPRED_006744 [Gomphillus americanus]|uniref:Major facilitator superfamily (MFS) profile domain-containing protein n=1 Tax=Gomphillus americanus TaxID=1940652 RepID=A0A8H3ES19_9LECA|nr:MAG: hypothetical protein GOMPHAMPRED_006744 [Gomphillus americanus]
MNPRTSAETELEVETQCDGQSTLLAQWKADSAEQLVLEEETFVGDQHRVKGNDEINWWNRPSVSNKFNRRHNTKTYKVWRMILPYFIYSLAFGGSMFLRTNLILELLCRRYYTEADSGSILPEDWTSLQDHCRKPEVQALASRFTFTTDLICGILAAISCPKLGALSDRYGRIKVLCIPATGTLMSEAIITFVAFHPGSLSINWLYLAYFFEGLCGSFIAVIAITHSYLADCTTPENRNVVFGWFHGCLWSGFAVGSLLVTAVIRATGDYRGVFYISVACRLCFSISLLVAVPESVSHHQQLIARRLFSKRKLEMDASLGHLEKTVRKVYDLFSPLKFFWPKGHGSSPALRRNLALLAVVDAVTFGIAMGSFNVLILYSRHEFGWRAYEQSFFFAGMNFTRICCSTIVMPAIVWLNHGTLWNPKSESHTGCEKLDLALLRSALAFYTLGYIGYALATVPTLFIISGVATAIAGLALPMLQSVMTKHISAIHTGQMLGASGLLHSLARIVTPFALNGMYGLTVGTMSHFAFVFVAIILGTTACLCWFVMPGVYLDDDAEVHQPILKSDDTDEEVHA